MTIFNPNHKQVAVPSTSMMIPGRVIRGWSKSGSLLDWSPQGVVVSFCDGWKSRPIASMFIDNMNY